MTLTTQNKVRMLAVLMGLSGLLSIGTSIYMPFKLEKTTIELKKVSGALDLMSSSSSDKQKQAALNCQVYAEKYYKLFHQKLVIVGWIFAVVTGVVGLICSVGVYLIKDWARKITVFLYVLFLIYVPILFVERNYYRNEIIGVLEKYYISLNVVSGENYTHNLDDLKMLKPGQAAGMYAGIVLELLWSGFVVFYLSRKSIRGEFRKSSIK